ncbi:hypothetical protein BH24ACI4_BH24ACI4_34490 [soil metagenome]
MLLLPDRFFGDVPAGRWVGPGWCPCIERSLRVVGSARRRLDRPPRPTGSERIRGCVLRRTAHVGPAAGRHDPRGRPAVRRDAIARLRVLHQSDLLRGTCGGGKRHHQRDYDGRLPVDRHEPGALDHFCAGCRCWSGDDYFRSRPGRRGSGWSGNRCRAVVHGLAGCSSAESGSLSHAASTTGARAAACAGTGSSAAAPACTGPGPADAADVQLCGRAAHARHRSVRRHRERPGDDT